MLKNQQVFAQPWRLPVVASLPDVRDAYASSLPRVLLSVLRTLFHFTVTVSLLGVLVVAVAKFKARHHLLILYERFRPNQRWRHPSRHADKSVHRRCGVGVGRACLLACARGCVSE